MDDTAASYQPLASQDGIETPEQQRLPERWTSGICACFDDTESCCIGLWCPCLLFGRNVEVLEDRPWLAPCVIHFLLWAGTTGLCCFFTGGLGFSCVPCYACNVRKSLRDKYNLEDAPCGDFLTHLCCHPCALCQEYRELKERSPNIGHSSPELVPPSVQSMNSFP